MASSMQRAIDRNTNVSRSRTRGIRTAMHKRAWRNINRRKSMGGAGG